jgi:hypothetical protein
MSSESTETPSIRPPVALGCFSAVAVVFLVVMFGFFALRFLDSGADTGEMMLDVEAAYMPGTATYVGARNFYLVRLGLRDFYALADLDAANRANAVRRCRAVPVQPMDPSLPGLIERLQGRMSPAATGSTLVFREDCFGAVYDVTGVRLDGEGPNLDRYPVTVNAQGRVVVDVADRECTVRTEMELSREVTCPGMAPGAR